MPSAPVGQKKEEMPWGPFCYLVPLKTRTEQSKTTRLPFKAFTQVNTLLYKYSIFYYMSNKVFKIHAYWYTLMFEHTTSNYCKVCNSQRISGILHVNVLFTFHMPSIWGTVLSATYWPKTQKLLASEINLTLWKQPVLKEGVCLLSLIHRLNSIWWEQDRRTW